MSNISNITNEQYESILKRFIYGERIGNMAKEYGVNRNALYHNLELLFGAHLTDYRYDSLIVYLQHPDHTVKSASKHFHICVNQIQHAVASRIEHQPYAKNYFRNLPLDKLRKMKAPYEQHIIRYLEQKQRDEQPTCSLFANLTKDERIARAREMNMRVKRNVEEARRRRKLEREAAMTHKSKNYKDPFYSKLLA